MDGAGAACEQRVGVAGEKVDVGAARVDIMCSGMGTAAGEEADALERAVKLGYSEGATWKLVNTDNVRA